MKTIWKYELETLDLFGLDMPRGAEVLTVQMQKGKPCLWAVVDTGNDKENRTFAIHGTGHDVNNADSKKYIGTYQLMGGDLVFHMFELIDS